MNVFAVSFYGYRAIEYPLYIEQYLETLICKLLKEYVMFPVAGMEKWFLPPFAEVNGLYEVTTALIFEF